MSWVAVAIGGSALLGYLGSQNAASAQSNAANQASATSNAQYNQTRQDQMPWMNRGNAAGNLLAYYMGLPGYQNPWGGQTTQGPVNGGSLGSFMGGGSPQYVTDGGYGFVDVSGLGGGSPREVQDGTGVPMGGMNSQQGFQPQGGFGSLAQKFGMGQFQADPGYQFRLAEGQKALERSAASKGMTLSGAQQKSLANYNQNFASNEYGNAYNRYNNDQTNLFNRLSGIAGTGQQANQFVGTMGAQNAANVGNYQTQAGNAAAAGWIGGTNAIQNGVGQYLNWNNANNWMNAMKTDGK